MLDHDLGKPASPEAFNLFDRKFLVAYQHRCHRVPHPPLWLNPLSGFSPRHIKHSARTRCMCLRPREQGGASGDEVGYSVGLAIGDAIANGEHLDLLDPRRRAEFDDVALMRFHQRSGDR